MKPESLQRKERLSGLDGLRGLAALSVFYVHFNQIVQLDAEFGPVSLYRLLANGNHAVSLFFSLSGLLLSLPFWRAIAAGTALPSLGGYLLRRIFRILPAYYVALTLLVVLSGLWRIPGARPDILLHYSFLFNYAEFSIFSINAPFWTLAVEFQFYLLLPVLFLVARRLPARFSVWFFILTGACAYGLHVWLVQSVSRTIPWPGDPRLTWIRPHGAVLYHSLLANLPHFLIGVIAGKWFLLFQQSNAAGNGKRITWISCDITFWSCLIGTLILLGTGWAEKITLPHSPYSLPLVPLLLGAMVFTVPFSRVARWLLDSPPLRGLGAVSYGFYIYHVPCLNYLDRRMTQSGFDIIEHWFVFGCAGFLLALLAATLSYFIVEKPCLKLVHRRK